MAGHVLEWDETTFAEEVAGDRPVLVDFTASWCAPCRAIAPVLEAVAEDEAERLRVAKVDVDANPELARRFKVMSLPTLVLFDKGEPVKRIVGSRGRGQLMAEIGPALS